MKTYAFYKKKSIVIPFAMASVLGIVAYLAPLSFWIDLVAWHLGAQNNQPIKCESKTPAVALKKEFPYLPEVNQLVGMYQSPGDPKNWYLLQQKGIIYKLNSSSRRLNIFLNLTKKVNGGGEKGLLGLAFHPKYRQNKYVFLYYTAGNLVSRISRFQVKKSGLRNLDSASEKILMEVEQPESNHNGGQIAFGQDGYLYISLGDGGGAGDRHGKIGNSQNTNTLLGSILRIDVNVRQGYKIPASNPFVNKKGRDEIYAWGIRNAWRMSFDPFLGDLWAADVGQDKWEEINLIKKGKNYGWRIREASHCYRPSKNCRSKGLVNPVHEYSHREGRSVTGGYVYRGRLIRGLQGMYLFTDFFKGPLWALKKQKNGSYKRLTLMKLDLYTSSFAQGNDGEVYILNYAGNAGEAVYKIVKGRGCRS